MVTLFGEAALRGKKAGFDGVQIYAAHGYLLNQFLTPYYNRRTNEYGGNIHNRARIIYEVINEIKAKVGVPSIAVNLKGLASVFLSLGTKFAIFSIKSMATH
ncbi:oxidoreductase [Candidatus Cetobacterium colombiensis]|uniref:oxidoreductase n=1 Tax=Candidatus Cetobacterium colombiensis TaxID=3073100 RepID=UPI00387DC711